MPPGGRRTPERRFHPADQVLDEVLEHRRVQLVMDRLPFAFGDNQAAGTQDGQMPRDRRPARVELGGDFTGRARAVAEEIEDVAARLVGEGAIDGVRRPAA